MKQMLAAERSSTAVNENHTEESEFVSKTSTILQEKG